MNVIYDNYLGVGVEQKLAVYLTSYASAPTVFVNDIVRGYWPHFDDSGTQRH